MKKYGMLVLAVSFIFSMAVMAQDQMPQRGQGGARPEMRQGNRQMATPQIRAERLAKELSLTDAEKTQVQALYEKQDAERQKLQADGQKSREEMKTQFDAQRKLMDENLEKIIGAEKMQKYQTLRAERMKQRGENSPRP